MHASNKEVIGSQKIAWSEVRQGGKQERRERHASKEERDLALGSGWQGRQGEEPQASHRDWAFRSAEERC